MNYKTSVCGVQVILNQAQLDLLMAAMQDAYQVSERHVGKHKGSMGYDNAYVPTVELKQPHEWLSVHLVADDFIEATKLVMSLDKSE